MKIQMIYDFLDKIAPFSIAEELDNVGLLVGDKNVDVTGIICGLDFTEGLLESALKCGANLVITHHPIIFSPLKSVNENSLVFKAIRANVNVISAHTNLDLAKNGVNKALSEALHLSNVKDFQNIDNIGVIGELSCEMTAKKFAEFAKLQLGAKVVAFTDCNKLIKTVAVVGGSGKDYMRDSIVADAYLTGEVSHDTYIDAKNADMQIFTVGHYESEAVILEPLCSMLESEFNIKVTAFKRSEISFI